MELRGRDLEQRGLAGAVGSEDHPALVLLDLPADVVEQQRPATAHGDPCELDDGDHGPSPYPAGGRRRAGHDGPTRCRASSLARDASAALPHSAVLAWWLTAWLRGHEQTDHVLDVARRRHPARSTGGSALDLLDDRAGLRGVVRRAGAAGRGRPARAGRAARLQRGRDGRRARRSSSGTSAWCPRSRARRCSGGRTRRRRASCPTSGEADRTLRESLLGAAGDLADLEVARWRPEAADALMNLHHRPRSRRPLGTPPRCVDLAARGLQAWAIVDLALVDDGGALSSYEVERRRGAAAAAGPRRPPRDRRGLLARGVAGPLAAGQLAQTPSTLPLGSANTKRRPPGNS